MSCNFCGGSGMNAHYQDCPYCMVSDDAKADEPTVEDKPDVTIIDTPTKPVENKKQSIERSKRDDK